MQETAFEYWLQTTRGLAPQTCRSRIANCRTIEHHEGDLDQHYLTDRCRALLDRLSYGREDANAGRKVQHAIPIDGDQHNGTATLRSALNLYVAFCAQGTPQGADPPQPQTPGVAVRRASRTQGSANWLTWQQPSATDLLTLACITTPYIQFLHPEIVRAIVEDNERSRHVWSTALQQRGITPSAYLWERSACAFPGVRRYAGSTEIARHRRRLTDDTTSVAEALSIDSNNYPKHVWSFILRGRPFQQFGPEGYELAHLLDHKSDPPARARLNREVTHPEHVRIDVPLYGLFTSTANTVYLPKGLIRPTDFMVELRALIQQRAQQLYGAFCNLVPPPWTIRESADPRWALDAFTWAEPIGSIQYLQQFLTFRHEQVERLLEG